MKTHKYLLSSLILSIIVSPIWGLYSDGMSSAHSDYSKEIAKFYGLNSTKHLTLLKVQGYQQTEDYTCGPAAVMSLMHYYGLLKDDQMNHETEMKIAKEMGTNNKTGTSPQQIVSWLKQHGFDVKSGENGTIKLIQNNLKKGIPTLVEWIDWGGHWVVTTGYDAVGKDFNDDKDTLLLADSTTHTNNIKTIYGITSINPDRFSQMWFDAQFFNPGKLTWGVYIVATPKASKKTRGAQQQGSP